MLSKYALNNYRMAGYLFIALGLINMRYQTGANSVVTNSLLIIIPGAALLLLTFVKGAYSLLARREIMAMSMLIGIVLLGFAFIN